MNKKTITIIAIVLVVAICIIASLVSNNNQSKKTNENNITSSTTKSTEITTEATTEKQDDDQNNSNSKVLIVYYSAQNHTKEIALKIARGLNAETFEIVPKNKYTEADLDWTDSNARVTKEHDNESLRNVELVTIAVPNFDDYDTVLIGYPIWWGVAAWPVDTFVKNNDFKDKTVIPFCTSASSGLGNSGELLEREAKGGKWMEGKRFSSYASDDEVNSWINSIK